MDCFSKKLLTTLTAQNSACIKCSTIFLSKAAALGKSLGSMGKTGKMWGFVFSVNGKLTTTGIFESQLQLQRFASVMCRFCSGNLDAGTIFREQSGAPGWQALPSSTQILHRASEAPAE